MRIRLAVRRAVGWQGAGRGAGGRRTGLAWASWGATWVDFGIWLGRMLDSKTHVGVLPGTQSQVARYLGGRWLGQVGVKGSDGSK